MINNSISTKEKSSQYYSPYTIVEVDLGHFLMSAVYQENSILRFFLIFKYL